MRKYLSMIILVLTLCVSNNSYAYPARDCDEYYQSAEYYIDMMDDADEDVIESSNDEQDDDEDEDE